MKITRFSADGFRNLKDVEFFPDEEMNVIYGENGQGKTNIIEAMWLYTGCYSFRTQKNIHLIAEGNDFAKTELDFFAHGRDQTAKMTVAAKKDIILNGINCDSPRQMLGEFYAVVFSPSMLSVVKEGPGERRKFLNVAISLVKPNYAGVMSKYLRVLAQRNSVLKKMSEMQLPPEYLEALDVEFVRLASKIIRYRLDYIEELKESAGSIYGGISSDREKFSFTYDFSKNEKMSDDEIKEKLKLSLEKSRESDIRRQFTATGPQTDDLILTLDGRDARSYGSQGQQRSCALALKLAEASIVRKLTGERPVVLLDDVMSELDERRQNFILNYLSEGQVFITCCDPSQLLRSAKGKAFEVKNGKAVNI